MWIEPAPCSLSRVCCSCFWWQMLQICWLCQLYSQHERVPVVWWQKMHLSQQQLQHGSYVRVRRDVTGMLLASLAYHPFTVCKGETFHRHRTCVGMCPSMVAHAFNSSNDAEACRSLRVQGLLLYVVSSRKGKHIEESLSQHPYPSEKGNR